MPDATIDEIRGFYARCMATAARQLGWQNGCAFQTRLEGAFEAVPRELFLPPGPWHVQVGFDGYVETPGTDVRYLYQDVRVAIDRERGINNGQPSLHARCMGRLEPRPGETVVHVGAGTGYYTAILSMLVAPGGRVDAFELDPELAARARRNLQALENVSVTVGDATKRELPEADVIYVNAGVTSPPLHWLTALRPGGRMFVPWRPTADIAAALFIRRTKDGFSADATMPCWFIPCVGASAASPGDRPPDSNGARATRSLHLTAERPPDGTATAIYRELWLSSQHLGSAGPGGSA
jgi:protein-L-isoaspartate(D-aspartate) O-methyltransferase